MVTDRSKRDPSVEYMVRFTSFVDVTTQAGLLSILLHDRFVSVSETLREHLSDAPLYLLPLGLVVHVSQVESVSDVQRIEPVVGRLEVYLLSNSFGAQVSME